MRWWILVLVAFVVATACTAGVAVPRQPVRITADSVGGLALTRTLAALRRQHPDARDSIYHEHEAVYPALLFRVGNVRAIAVQTRMDAHHFHPRALEPACPADFWMIEGSGGVLPGAVPLDALWPELLRAYGQPIVWSNQSVVGLRFDYLMDWSFHLDLAPEQLDRQRTAADSLRVLRGSRIWRVLPPATASDECGNR